jgi:hypothetical protein
MGSTPGHERCQDRITLDAETAPLVWNMQRNSPFYMLCFLRRYANVKTPQRHVRTRLYFTSESHIHSLINVLRYCHFDDKLRDQEPLISEEALQRLYETKELDYLTHIVLRLYENTEVSCACGQFWKREVRGLGSADLGKKCFCLYDRKHLDWLTHIVLRFYNA